MLKIPNWEVDHSLDESHPLNEPMVERGMGVWFANLDLPTPDPIEKNGSFGGCTNIQGIDSDVIEAPFFLDGCLDLCLELCLDQYTIDLFHIIT